LFSIKTDVQVQAAFLKDFESLKEILVGTMSYLLLGAVQPQHNVITGYG